MSMSAYFKERLLFLLLQLMLITILSGLLILFQVEIYWIGLMFLLWMVPLLFYMMLEYKKEKRFFTSLEELTESLEEKYLLPEVMEKSDLLAEKLFYDVLQDIGRDMHEQVKYHREQGKEYREYIETWVHEIKTPMASIGLILENQDIPYKRTIMEEMKKIEDYVEEVLYYARSSHVEKDYIIRELSLEALVKKVVKRNASDFIRKGISLELYLSQDKVYSDSKWLEYILHQILSNALKYTQGKEGKIIISAEKRREQVVLSVKDTGIGILGKDLSRVTEKGFTGENGRVYHRSTGMGLYLVKKLSEQLGLGLEISSKNHQGTLVEILFPLGSYHNGI